MVDTRQIKVESNGEVLAQATVSMPDHHNIARAQMTVAPGHLPVGVRQKLADAVCEVVAGEKAGHLTASVPMGDVELIVGISGHLSDVEVRAAGATSIIEGDVEPPQAPLTS